MIVGITLQIVPRVHQAFAKFVANTANAKKVRFARAVKAKPLGSARRADHVLRDSTVWAVHTSDGE